MLHIWTIRQFSFIATILVLLTVIFVPKGQNIPKSVIYPSSDLQHFSFGYKEQLADIFWIRVIQDFDFCDVVVSERVCRNNSWLFGMLDLITDLAPKFRMPYATGALALTIIITDVEGATKIFEKGVKELPNDWPILYRAAYHYLYEVNDQQRAAELLKKAGENGAPPWVFTLAGRLYTDSGRLDLAYKILEDMRLSKQDESFIKRLEEKIASIEAEQAAKK